MIIFTPQLLKNHSKLSEFITSHYKWNIKMVPGNRNQLPQCIKDLIRSISIKNIQNSSDIVRKIKTFNYYIEKRMEALSKKENNK